MHFALAVFYRHTGNDDSALIHHQLAFVKPHVRVAPYYGSGPPIDVLLLVAAHGGNVVTHPFFDNRVVRLYTLVAEGYKPWLRTAAASRYLQRHRRRRPVDRSAAHARVKSSRVRKRR